MKNFCALILVLVFSSCLKLDTNLYNEQKKVDDYLFDNYTGEQDFILNETFKIKDSLINRVSLISKGNGESTTTPIEAVYIGDINRIITDTVILYCHGNKWHMDFYWQRAKLLAHVNGKNQYGVMMMDYRGYGLSKGKPTEDGMFEDVNACLEWLRLKGLKTERLIIYGFSLGSAPACELTANPRKLVPSKIILEAPFGSAAVMVQDAARLNMPTQYFTDLKIDNAEEIKKITQPFLWIHGLDDNFLNYKTHGEVVYKNYGGEKQSKFLVEGADHGEVPAKMGFGEYCRVIGEFVRK